MFINPLNCYSCLLTLPVVLWPLVLIFSLQNYLSNGNWIVFYWQNPLALLHCSRVEVQSFKHKLQSSLWPGPLISSLLGPKWHHALWLLAFTLAVPSA